MHSDWWVLRSNRCVNDGESCGLLTIHHGIYSNPSDMEWLMLLGRQDEAFEDEGEELFCMAFVKLSQVIGPPLGMQRLQ